VLELECGRVEVAVVQEGEPTAPQLAVTLTGMRLGPEADGAAARF
jgi:hypothetical protein